MKWKWLKSIIFNFNILTLKKYINFRIVVLQGENLIEIIRKLNKEFILYHWILDNKYTLKIFKY